MKNSRLVLFAVALASLALLGFALYLQHVENMQPCPWCVIQRYVFAAVALLCLIGAALPRSATKAGAGLAWLAAVAGIGVAGWHVWLKANPEVSCGIDPLQTSLNTFPTAEWLPFLFKAKGFCSTDYAPILGLSIPQWSLAWFILFSLALGWIAFRRAR